MERPTARNKVGWVLFIALTGFVALVYARLELQDRDFQDGYRAGLEQNKVCKTVKNQVLLREALDSYLRREK
jgi:hypothetical protein